MIAARSVERISLRRVTPTLGFVDVRVPGVSLHDLKIAGLLATKLLKQRGLTWADVIGGNQRWELPPEIARAAEEARAARAAQRGAGDDLTLALRHMDRLKNWEQQFVTSVAIRTKRSPKQNQIIREIAAALRARGLG